MATDNERREVASRLRDAARAEGGPLGDIGFTEAMHRALGGSDWRDMTERLADLIDPDCGTAEAPTSPVPGCDGTRERLARALGIDLPALLALAEEMCRNTRGMLSDDKVDASDIWYYEHLLRKACGEEAQ